MSYKHDEDIDSGMKKIVSEFPIVVITGWWRSTVVERRSLTGELSLSCARPVADG